MSSKIWHLDDDINTLTTSPIDALKVLLIFTEIRFSSIFTVTIVASPKSSIEKIKDDNEDQDFFSAIKICKKKRIGPSRVEDNRELFYKKDISLLARNGFDFETSKRVMDLDKEDYLKIVNLL